MSTRGLPAGRSCRVPLPGSTPQVCVSPGKQTTQRQKRPWVMIDYLIRCGGKNMMFCLLKQYKLLCGRQRPSFFQELFPANERGNSEQTVTTCEAEASCNRRGRAAAAPWRRTMTHHVHGACLKRPARRRPLRLVAQLDGEGGSDP